VRSRRRIAVLLATASVLFSACGGASSSPSASSPASAAPPASGTAPSTEPTSAAPVTINWWHITTDKVGKPLFQSIADAYTKDHPNVTIKITVLENEAFKAKLTATAPADYPDLFQSWGGGTMAAQADAGLLQDITAAVAPWKDTINPGAMSIYAYNGKQYGVPWDMGMMGVWYNKDLFSKAGISAPPATWDDFLADVSKLRASGVAPLAIAGKDKWPSMHLWTYLVLRIGGADALQQMIQSGNYNTDACTKAGEQVLALNKLDPYQAGYASATYNDEAAAVGNGKAAMEVMGQWAPAVENDQSADKKGLGDKLGWFPFPSVAGGAGAATDGIGGGNGVAVKKDAPPEAIDFVKFFVSTDNANKLNQSGIGMSPVNGTGDTITDPNLKAVLAGRDQAKFIQLYLDQAVPPSVGAVVNDATVALFLGKSDPAATCKALTDAAANP
jgi:raffinose/stachyose/melibiose transport system substrate-binding protein